MCNTEKLGGAGDEVNTSLLDMFKIQAFIIYLCIHNWEMLSYTGDFFFGTSFDFNFHKGGVKGQYLSTALAQNIDFNLLKMVL